MFSFFLVFLTSEVVPIFCLCFFHIDFNTGEDNMAYVICKNLLSLRTAVYAIASLFLVLQLVMAVRHFLAKPSMTSPGSKPFARQGV